MLDKEIFKKFITSYQKFYSGIERLETAITGNTYDIFLMETDWGIAAGEMLDTFLESHFTDDGIDLVTWWMFEDVDKVIYEKPQQLDFFIEEDNKERTVPVETIDELWNYMVKNKEFYFL